MRAEEWDYAVNGMLIDHGDDVFLVAIPQKVSLETLANIRRARLTINYVYLCLF